MISGPLSAFRFGTPGGAPIPKLDNTFNPKILYEEGRHIQLWPCKSSKKSRRYPGASQSSSG